MEELFEQLKRAVSHETERTATAMDGSSDRMADAAAASYIASIAEDAEFKEEAHPREAKGGKGGGRFRTSGKTIEKEDSVEPKSTLKEGGKRKWKVGDKLKYRYNHAQIEPIGEITYLDDKVMHVSKPNGIASVVYRIDDTGLRLEDDED